MTTISELKPLKAYIVQYTQVKYTILMQAHFWRKERKKYANVQFCNIQVRKLNVT